ncbi:MAG TPA: hypothetical protein VIZ65_16045 [Cellvibrionaceae bacterium]
MSIRFKSRTLVSVSLLLLFAGLLVTSVLMFTRSHNTTTALMHTVLGTAILMLIFWHLTHNFAALRQHLKWSGARAKANSALAVALVFVATLAAATFYQWAPFEHFYNWGAAMRLQANGPQQMQFTYMRVDATATQATGEAMRIDLRSGPQFDWPQYAFWLETLDGTLIQPLYVTRKLAQNQFDTRVTRKAEGLVFTSNPLKAGKEAAIFDFVSDPDSASDRARPESLPVFLHKLAQAHSTHDATIDGYAGATIQQSFLLSTRAKSPVAAPYRVRFEINQSFDFNDYYSSDRFPDDAIYSGNGYSAQPSLIYEAVINPGSNQRYYPMQLIGRGHHSGQDGDIHADMNNMTTALEIIDRIIIEIPTKETNL